jgi:hypothetical protein
LPLEIRAGWRHNQQVDTALRRCNMRFVHLLFLLAACCGISAAQETSFAEGPAYLSLTGTTMLRPIATPMLSLDASLPTVPNVPEIGPPVTGQPFVANPEVANQPDLFPIYYGYPPVPVIELVNTESTPELPASITGVGITTFMDEQTLQRSGYGVTVGEAAAYWKEHKPPVSRVYTNNDIQRLRHP